MKKFRNEEITEVETKVETVVKAEVKTSDPEILEVPLLKAEELSKQGYIILGSKYKDGKKIYLLKEAK